MPRASTKPPEPATDDSYPDWWDFDEDGDEIAGTFQRAGRGFTVNGERTFVVLDVDGVERTLWLHHTVLQSIFAREIQRRPDKQIAVGEQIVIRRRGERTGNNGRDYTNYKGDFPDGPVQSQVDIFGPPPELAGSQAEPASATSSPENSDGDIPF